jgi:hypothetical protein
MTKHEALTLIIDAARQQAALNRSGRNEGLADLQDQACAVCALSFGLEMAVERVFPRPSIDRGMRVGGGAQ